MAPAAVIFGCAGPEPTAVERAFFAEADPWGFILFARNVGTPEQMRRLIAALREAVGRQAPVLIDQEGGRVARMRGPHWREWRPALDEVERLPEGLRARAMRLRYRLIAGELAALGIDVNCAPVLDVARPESHAVLRDRCYGDAPDAVAEIGRAVAEGLLAGGVLPVMKHVPGQGRARLDSHRELPVIEADRAELEAVDFHPFRALADLPMAMASHVVYAALDPGAPASQSPRVVAAIRREIGYDGLLMTDDLSMHALVGPFGRRAERALAAGCDVVLHCNGDAAEMAAVAGAVPRLEGAALGRAERALAARGAGEPEDAGALAAAFAELQGRASA